MARIKGWKRWQRAVKTSPAASPLSSPPVVKTSTLSMVSGRKFAFLIHLWLEWWLIKCKLLSRVWRLFSVLPRWNNCSSRTHTTASATNILTNLHCGLSGPVGYNSSSFSILICTMHVRFLFSSLLFVPKMYRFQWWFEPALLVLVKKLFPSLTMSNTLLASFLRLWFTKTKHVLLVGLPRTDMTKVMLKNLFLRYHMRNYLKTSIVMATVPCKMFGQE